MEQKQEPVWMRVRRFIDDEAHLSIKQVAINIKAEQEKLRKIELARSELRGGKGDDYDHISMRSIPAYQVLSVRGVVPTYYSEGDLWRELSAYASTGKIEVAGDAFSIYHDTEFRKQDVDIELCLPVKQAGQNHFRVIPQRKSLDSI